MPIESGAAVYHPLLSGAGCERWVDATQSRWSGGRARGERRVGCEVSAVDRVRERQRSQKRAHPR